jgi:hypothetical protein
MSTVYVDGTYITFCHVSGNSWSDDGDRGLRRPVAMVNDHST